VNSATNADARSDAVANLLVNNNVKLTEKNGLRIKYCVTVIDSIGKRCLLMSVKEDGNQHR